MSDNKDQNINEFLSSIEDEEYTAYTPETSNEDESDEKNEAKHADLLRPVEDDDSFKTNEIPSEEIPHSLSTPPEDNQFHEDTEEISPDKAFEKEKTDVDNSHESLVETQHHDPEPDDKEPVPDFSVKGTRSWNTREPYTISISSSKYDKDLIRLEKSFCYIPPGFKSDAELKRYVNRELLRYRTHSSSGSILNDYIVFIQGEIVRETGSLLDYFKVDQSERSVFIYHLGPLTIYKILSSIFHKKKYGSCCMLSEENKTIMFFPDEFIKVQTLHWFEENISSLDIPFDSVHYFDKFKKNVTKNYHAVLSKFDQRHAELNRKLGSKREVSKSELLRLKGESWFGSANIEVYKRYVPRTIFN